MLDMASKGKSVRIGRVGQLGNGWLLMCDLQLRTVITSSFEIRLGVLGLYGKPIDSIFYPWFCGG